MTRGLIMWFCMLISLLRIPPVKGRQRSISLTIIANDKCTGNNGKRAAASVVISTSIFIWRFAIVSTMRQQAEWIRWTKKMNYRAIEIGWGWSFIRKHKHNFFIIFDDCLPTWIIGFVFHLLPSPRWSIFFMGSLFRCIVFFLFG